MVAAFAGLYTIERELGRGGMATVYLATDQKHDRRVAIKVLDPEFASVIGPQRFVQEIEIASRLTHPHILPLYASGSADGLLYYVMPYVDGESLRVRLERERNLSLQDAVAIVRSVASALTLAHREGVIHRDIKPENILLAEGEAVVADFGIARAIGAAGPERMTATGLVIGTPAYMSPEQVGGERALDERSDVYSLGCVAYEMLGGQPPFTGPSAQAVMARHVADPVPPLRTLRPGTPLGVERAIEKALAKVPADRFATADAFAAALERASTDVAIEAERGRAGRNRRRWAAALVAGATLITAATWWFLRLAAAPAIQRFAVLPFAATAVDTQQVYFAEGIHDGLISELARDGLGVIARTSVMQYRNTDKPVRVIAQELGVDAVVEASLTRTADSVSIEAGLVDGRTEQYLWSHVYAGGVRQVPVLTRDMALAIAHALQPRRAPSATLPAPVAEVDPEAYDAYLKGQFHLHRPGREELETARQYFELALARDSTYAPAWAGISSVWGIGRQRGYFSPQQATPLSDSAAFRSIALDSTLADPHYALAEGDMYARWDWQGADREFRRASALRPDYAEVRAFYAHLLCVLGRPREAIQQMDRALQLDPFDPLLQWLYGAVLTLVGRYDDAATLYRRALQSSPDNPAPAWLLWVTLHVAGRFDQAWVEAQNWARADGSPGVEEALHCGYQQGGYAGAMRAVADNQAEQSKTRYVEAWSIAIWYAAAGDNERTIEWLERAFTEHDPTMPYLAVHPAFKHVHGDPRFQDLLRRMNLPG